MENAIDSRRRCIVQGLAAVASGAGWSSRVQAQSRQIVVADPGGPYGKAYRAAFYDPFEKQTGIKVVNVAREAQPLAQFTAMVQTRNYIWDVTTLTLTADIPTLQAKNLLEPINLKVSELPGIIPEAVTSDFLGIDVVGTTIAYRSDKFSASGPKNWADFWDVKRFPGRRALRRSPIDTIEQALLADGVQASKLYPLDLDRAFKSLERIKPHVAVWWTSGAQSMQLIQSGEVDMLACYNGRSQAAIDGGAPVTIEWNQGLSLIEGWGIPKGTPRAEMAKEFVRFCASPRQQAIITDELAYGPTNLKAYEFIQPKRAAMLPTAAANFKGLISPDPQWWFQNRDKVTERFNAWVVG